MEKKLEAQLDAESMTTVNVKEYAPSEAFSAEPPPAYQRPKSAAVQVARIAAVTVVLVSFIMGSFIFAAAWVQANSACQDALNEQIARMDQMLEDRALGPQYQPLVGEQGDSADSDQQPQSASQTASQTGSQHAKREEPRQDKDDRDDDQQENAIDPPIHLKLPLQLDFDELAGALMERNQRSRMNCVVEKRRAEEVVDHQPRTVRLPFGLNLTTDPRYEHVSGERMAIFCESGHDQRHVPMEQMGSPIVVPVQQGPMGSSGPMGPMGPMGGPMQPSHQQLQQQMQQQHQQQMQQQLQQQIQMHLQQLHQQQLQRQHEQQMQQQMQQQQQQQQQFGPPPPPQHMPIQVLPMSQAEARGFQQNTPLVVMHASQQSPRQGRHFFPSDEAEQAELVPRGRGFQGQGIPIELRDVPMQASMTVEVEGRGEPLEVEGRSLTPQQLHQLQQLHSQGGAGPQILPVEVIEARAFQHPQDMQQPEGPAPLPADTLRPPYQRTPSTRCLHRRTSPDLTSYSPGPCAAWTPCCTERSACAAAPATATARP